MSERGCQIPAVGPNVTSAATLMTDDGTVLRARPNLLQMKWGLSASVDDRHDRVEIMWHTRNISLTIWGHQARLGLNGGLGQPGTFGSGMTAFNLARTHQRGFGRAEGEELQMLANVGQH